MADRGELAGWQHPHKRLVGIHRFVVGADLLVAPIGRHAHIDRAQDSAIDWQQVRREDNCRPSGAKLRGMRLRNARGFLLHLADVAVHMADAIRREVFAHFHKAGVLLGCTPRPRHTRLRVGDDRGVGERAGAQQRCQGQQHAGWVAARVGDQRRVAQGVAVQFGQAIGRGQQLGRGVFVAVPLLVCGGRGQAEVGR